MTILDRYKERFTKVSEEEMSLEDYLALCKKDPSAYATPAERLLKAIGPPVIVDTAADPRLSRIFANRKIKRYTPFEEFYGMEEAIESIVAFLKHSSQGLEERKQILYLLGPVGGGKSSLAEKLKDLMEQEPFYALKGSPIHESPLGLFTDKEDKEALCKDLKIPIEQLRYPMSPWAAKRLVEANGDLNAFTVVKLYPSRLHQIAIAKTEPGDENNQDISALVGKSNIRKLGKFDQSDPDSYSFSGGLARGNRGLLEFVEMFKAPIKMLHPLLTATQEGNYNGTEALSSIPFEGLILAHSNESEWKQFKNNKNNEAFIDRVSMVKVPYCLRLEEEINIYNKLIESSALRDLVCAPYTLKMLAQFTILSRIVDPENSSIYSKLKVYNGENLKETDPGAKSLQEYKELAGEEEGMSGVSTRFAFKILSKVFNFDVDEVAANPVHLLYVLETQINKEQLPDSQRAKYLDFLKSHIVMDYVEFIGKEIQQAYLESYSDFGQNLFDKYVIYADNWIQDVDYRDPDTGEVYNRNNLNAELETIEKAAGIANPKDFRNEIVNFVLRARARNGGNNPKWTSYEKLRKVIEHKIFSNTEEILPLISFSKKSSKEDSKKHEDFVNRMVKKGYTKKQVRLLSDWYIRVRKNS